MQKFYFFPTFELPLKTKSVFVPVVHQYDLHAMISPYSSCNNHQNDDLERVHLARTCIRE